MLKIFMTLALLLGQNLFGQEESKVDFTFAPDGRQWRVGYQADDESSSITEYVLENQKVANWSELVTLQNFPGISVSPKVYFELFTKELEKSVGQDKLGFKVIDSTENSLLGEWWVKGTDKSDQHEYIRIFVDNNMLSVLRYTAKRPEDWSRYGPAWKKILTEAKYTKQPAKKAA